MFLSEYVPRGVGVTLVSFRWPSCYSRRRATMSAVVVFGLVPLATYVKDILSRSTKTNSNRIIELTL